MTERVQQVTPEVLDPGDTAHITACVLSERNGSELSASFEAGFGFAHATGDVFFRELLDVERELAIEVGFGAAAAEH